MLSRLDQTKLLPTATMIVHIAAESLEKGHGVCRVPGVGPTTMGIVKDWLGHCRVRVRPVIDLNDVPPPVDCHEIPDRHRRLVLLRQPASTFPWSTATSRLDLDHVQPYVPECAADRRARPGSTTKRRTPAANTERSPTAAGTADNPTPASCSTAHTHGDIYLTNHSGTHDLGDGTFARAIWRLAGRGHDQQPGRLGRS